MNKPVKQKDKIELKLDILEFAQEHNLAVHPDKDLDHFCEATVTLGHCICRNDELYCPCDSALPLCQKEGHCTCRLFITCELYPIELVKFRERWKKHENSSLYSQSLSAMPRGERNARKRAFLNQRS